LNLINSCEIVGREYYWAPRVGGRESSESPCSVRGGGWDARRAGGWGTSHAPGGARGPGGEKWAGGGRPAQGHPEPAASTPGPPWVVGSSECPCTAAPCTSHGGTGTGTHHTRWWGVSTDTGAKTLTNTPAGGGLH